MVASWMLLLLAGPSIAAADSVLDVTGAGAVGDAKTLNTAQIQKAIDDCAVAGGGTVHFPAGRYLTGTIQIKSNVALKLDDGATLLGSTEVDDYKNLDPFTDGSGNPMGHALIVAVDADHVGIEGSGTIDGQGAKLAALQDPYLIRPFLVRFVRCSNVSVRAVHLTNPGSWTLNFFQSRNIDIEGITVRSRDQKLRNNDGINLDSSENVKIQNCDVISGDDSLVIKSTSTRPSHDIMATGCKLSSHTNAIKLGTESLGGFENISVSNCQITDTHMSGIALYAVDGGDLRNVSVSDIAMDGVTVAISMRLGARLKTFREGDQPKPVGKLRDIAIRNVTAKNIKMIGMLINGIPGHPIEALTLENISLELPGGGTKDQAKVHLDENEAAYPEYDTFGKTMPAWGMYIRHVSGITFRNVRTTLLKPDARPAKVFIDVQNMTPSDFSPESPDAK
jgi:polygalacturonase